MTPLYPLTFTPVLKRYLWGGRRLGTVLGKALGEGDDYAESWEIADHAQGQSIVDAGPLAGMTLHELVERRGKELLGRHHPQRRFPLLFKFLDCQLDLSVQVHPGDAAAARLDPPDLGKTEAWVILEAQKGSRLFAGLSGRYDRESLARAVEAGQTEACLHEVAPRAGDCLFIPAGTVHALGAGLLVAEIQQASDTTYRLFDWNRVGPDGKPRPLHIDQSLDATDYGAIEIPFQRPIPCENPSAERLVDCDKFILDRWTLTESQRLGGDERFHIVSILEGGLRLGDLALFRGQTALLPACLPAYELTCMEGCIALDMYLP